MFSVSFSNLSARASNFLAESETINSFKEGAKKVSDFIEENAPKLMQKGNMMMYVGASILCLAAVVSISSQLAVGATLLGFYKLTGLIAFISGFLLTSAIGINRLARERFESLQDPILHVPFLGSVRSDVMVREDLRFQSRIASFIHESLRSLSERTREQDGAL